MDFHLNSGNHCSKTLFKHNYADNDVAVTKGHLKEAAIIDNGQCLLHLYTDHSWM